jgi:SPP1 gp7 family putative phage head morphogenesis protein
MTRGFGPSPDMASLERQYTRLLISKIRAWFRFAQQTTIERVNTYIDSWITDLYDDINGRWESDAEAATAEFEILILPRLNERNRRWWVQGVAKVTATPIEAVNPLAREPWLRDLMQERVKENANLIKDIGAQASNNIQRIVSDAVMNGTRAKNIEAAIKENIKPLRISVEKRAKRIAIDQINKHNAQMSQARMKDVSVGEYTWRTVGDQRVRPEHQARDGKRYKWSEPPPDGHPGQPVLCRCRAEPYLDDLEDIYGIPLE